MAYLNDLQDLTTARMSKLRRVKHPNCIFCGLDHGMGLNPEFVVSDNGGIVAEISCNESFQSYTGLIHGGILALLLDGAMTNCLFAAGVSAVTAEMSIRYVRSASTNKAMRLEARIAQSRPPFHLVEAEIHQYGVAVAKATGKFMER